MDVEHLWKFNETEINKLNQNQLNGSSGNRGDAAGSSSATLATNPLLAGLGNDEDTSPDLIANLCSVADHRLYKIVKWCKSLPLFKNISVRMALARHLHLDLAFLSNILSTFQQIDDQICLLINSWCELLLFSCCFRSISSPGEIRISQGKSVNLEQAKSSGLQARLTQIYFHKLCFNVNNQSYFNFSNALNECSI